MGKTFSGMCSGHALFQVDFLCHPFFFCLSLSVLFLSLCFLFFLFLFWDAARRASLSSRAPVADKSALLTQGHSTGMSRGTSQDWRAPSGAMKRQESFAESMQLPGMGVAAMGERIVEAGLSSYHADIYPLYNREFVTHGIFFSQMPSTVAFTTELLMSTPI